MGMSFEQRWQGMTEEVLRIKAQRDQFEDLLFRRVQRDNGCDPTKPPCRSPVPGGIYCGCALEMAEFMKQNDA